MTIKLLLPPFIKTTMNEITRFLQIRSVQNYSKEEHKQIGLNLYPPSGLSLFAMSLKDSGCNTEGREAQLLGFQQNVLGAGTPAIENPILKMLYDWLEYTARPIRYTGFENFIISELAPLAQAGGIPFPNDTDWQSIADTYVFYSHKDTESHTAVNYDLLIRCFYMLTLCIDNSSNMSMAKGNEELINLLLNTPIILPVGVVKSRCCNEQQPDIPQPDPQMIAEEPQLEIPDICDCTCDDSCKPPSNHCICIKPYVADLLMVKEELVRYEEGDVAYIENILAGEHKNRIHRNFTKTELYSETETEINTSEEKDHQVSEKFSLQSEVQKTVSSDLSLDAGVTYSNKFGKSMEVTAHANVASNYSKSKSESVARSYARDVIDRSVSKVSEKVRALESYRVIKELEETNEHGIDNVAGNHRAGIYYWVNKVTMAQLFNYGKRMMIDLYVPEPAALYKKLYQLKNESRKLVLEEPIKPTLAAKDITRTGYTSKLLEYGVTGGDVPPDELVSIQLSFQYSLSEPSDNEITTGFSENFKFEKIPDGYLAKKIDYEITCATGHPKNTDSQAGDERDEVAVLVHLGKVNVFNKNYSQRDDTAKKNEWSEVSKSIELDEESKITDFVSFGVSGYSTVGLALAGSATIQCTLSQSALETWQMKIYTLIMEDYNQKMAAYKGQKSEEEALIQIKGRNPFLNREIERNELKRHLIAVLMCNYFNGTGSMMNRVAPCGYPEFDFEKLEQDTPLIRFFEQVFEWNHVMYLFYSNMWARKCKWPELIDEDSGDPLFDKFLTAGASRVQVPVREGMEEVLGYYLATGKIWGESGVPPLYGDTGYVSVIQEIIEGRQGDYSQRKGNVSVINGSNDITLNDSTFYWDEINDQLHTLNIENDIDREILLDLHIYRIKAIAQYDPSDKNTWVITLERAYEGVDNPTLKHAVGARFVGAPWEVKVPTKLVYLQNETDKLPKYPLS
jgi:hypothetical protein